MYHIRQWAHNTAHKSKFNPWHGDSDLGKPLDKVPGQNQSPLSRSANQDEKAEPDKDKAQIPVYRRVWANIKRSIFHSWVNVLLVFVPAGIAVHFADVNPNVVFALNAIAIVPLAGLLTFATECVAHRLGPTLGALINVSFGNAVELIIFIALVKNEIRVVQASLIGSILANLLLILGMAFVIGGLQYREQVYDSTVTQMSACLLALAVLSLLIPTAFHASFNDLDLANTAVLKLSRGTSVILLLTYVLYLLFQLKSHAYLYQGTPQHIIDEQSQPGVLARFDSVSSSESSIASGNSIRSSSSGSVRGRKVRKRLRAKLGIKRQVKTEFVESTGETCEETGGDGLFPAQSSSHYQPTSASETNINHSRVVGSQQIAQEQEQEQEQVDQLTNLHKPRSKPLRPQITTSFSVPTGVSQNREPTSAATEPRRPPGALRAFSSFRPPPVFRSSTNPSLVPSQHPPPHQLRRLRSTPNDTHAFHQQSSLSANGVNATAGAKPSPSVNEPALSRTASIFLLLCSTGLVALCAEFLVGSIEHLVESSPLSEAFIGLIILPIVGNAAEHVTAVTVAAKNKLDLSLGVSLGSSIQIALFVTPVVVILGWILDKNMSLYFNLFEVVSLFVSTFIVNFLVLDGRSNYLEGALLCACYTIIAVGAYFFPDGQAQSALTTGSGGSD